MVVRKLSKQGGTVRDIRTGRAIAQTNDLGKTFVDHIVAMRTSGRACYVVTGNLRHNDLRIAVDMLMKYEVVVVRDKQFPPDTMWLFEGEPSELGFAV